MQVFQPLARFDKRTLLRSTEILPKLAAFWENMLRFSLRLGFHRRSGSGKICCMPTACRRIFTGTGTSFVEFHHRTADGTENHFQANRLPGKWISRLAHRGGGIAKATPAKGEQRSCREGAALRPPEIRGGKRSPEPLAAGQGAEFRVRRRGGGWHGATCLGAKLQISYPVSRRIEARAKPSSGVWLGANTGILPRSLAIDGKCISDGKCGMLITLSRHEDGRPVAMIPATGTEPLKISELRVCGFPW